MGEFIQQLKENLVFFLTCAAIAGGLFLCAKLAEKWLSSTRSVSKARKISIIAVCSAIATVLHILDFPLPFLVPGFYKLDFSELPVMLCGFYLGPASAVACEAVKILLKLLLQGTSTALWGILPISQSDAVWYCLP